MLLYFIIKCVFKGKRRAIRIHINEEKKPKGLFAGEGNGFKPDPSSMALLLVSLLLVGTVYKIYTFYGHNRRKVKLCRQYTCKSSLTEFTMQLKNFEWLKPIQNSSVVLLYLQQLSFS